MTDPEKCPTCGADITPENKIVEHLCPRCEGVMCDMCYPGNFTICMKCETEP